MSKNVSKPKLKDELITIGVFARQDGRVAKLVDNDGKHYDGYITVSMGIRFSHFCQRLDDAWREYDESREEGGS